MAGSCRTRSEGKTNICNQNSHRALLLRLPVEFTDSFWRLKNCAALAAGAPSVSQASEQNTPICAHCRPSVWDAVKNYQRRISSGRRILSRNSARNSSRIRFAEKSLLLFFVDATEVGKEIDEGAAKRKNRFLLELGRPCPVLVFEDADLDHAVEGTLLAKVRNTGQS